MIRFSVFIFLVLSTPIQSNFLGLIRLGQCLVALALSVGGRPLTSYFKERALGRLTYSILPCLDGNANGKIQPI
jgi:hypothetical protein